MKNKLEIQRQCVELRKEGYTLKEIGEKLGITRNVVAGHTYRARKAALEKGLVDAKAGEVSSKG